MHSESSFLFLGKPYRSSMDYKEAVDLYHISRNASDHLTLVGFGVESAYCLMLASRFQPDDVILSPLFGKSDPEGFFRCVKENVPFLFSVCAPVTVFLPNDVQPTVLKKISKLLMRTSSEIKKIEKYASDTELHSYLTNLNKSRKTLA